MLVKNNTKGHFRQREKHEKGTGKKEVRTVTCLKNCKHLLGTKRLSERWVEVVTEIEKESNILFQYFWLYQNGKPLRIFRTVI